TLNRSVARGEVLKLGDITMERRPRAEVGTDTVLDPEQVIGFAARSAISAGRPLRTADLMRPELVSRNDTVTIIYEVPGITLSMRGKAVDGGADGDLIDVINVQSKRTLRATVTGPGRVVVTSLSPQLTETEQPLPSAPARNTAK